jgi:glucan phosphoethanolaminetransferase (alkaline phosphatase superfamily)
MTKVYISRAVVVTIALGVLVGLVFWQITLNHTVLQAPKAFTLLAVTFTVFGYWISWIMRGFFKSNIDTAVHEMGPAEREVFIAFLQSYNNPEKQFSVKEFQHVGRSNRRRDGKKDQPEISKDDN